MCLYNESLNPVPSTPSLSGSLSKALIYTVYCRVVSGSSKTFVWGNQQWLQHPEVYGCFLTAHRCSIFSTVSPFSVHAEVCCCCPAAFTELLQWCSGPFLPAAGSSTQIEKWVKHKQFRLPLLACRSALLPLPLAAQSLFRGRSPWTPCRRRNGCV